MHDAPDARTLRRRRTLLLFLVVGLVVLGSRSSVIENVEGLVHGFHDGFADSAEG